MLGGARTEPADKVERLRAAVAATRQDAQTWKARAARADERGEAQAKRLSEAEAELADLRTRVAALRREVASPDVLQVVLAHRWQTRDARRRAAETPAAEREAAFAARSSAYRQALSAGAATLGEVVQPTTLDGLRWWVPASDAAGSSPAAQASRFPYHGILLSRELAVGGIMLDIGANIGRMAVPRAVLGDALAVYCAEPDPVSYACLASNVIDNGLQGSVMPDQTAIGDRRGHVRLRRTGLSVGFHVVGDDVESDTVVVPCTTLDEWVADLGIDLDAVTYVKVDVEGYERRLVAGAERVRSYRHIAWQMEIKPASLRAVGDEPGDLYAELARTFTHFIDMNRRAKGPRVREIGELGEALGYIDPRGKTDILLFSAT